MLPIFVTILTIIATILLMPTYISLIKNVPNARYHPKRVDCLAWIKASLLAPTHATLTKNNILINAASTSTASAVSNQETRAYRLVNVDIMFVDSKESQSLNNHYRGVKAPTNVIALEYPNTRIGINSLYGELILCDEIILHEARQANKTLISHYAHMIIHGMLHIQGLDHKELKEAQYMQNLEIAIMQQFGFDNPYAATSSCE